ncbi:hypothetical protein [uncultured Robinsoniella sp.]|uniref:hypothetical protein n=1 Tax=uncultured Robinsoniella sp. TaxID=904190 RepID=UPI00374E57D5
MRHFTNIDLEKYVPNNWLKAHGIPVKRKRQMLKASKSLFKSDAEYQNFRLFFADEFHIFDDINEAKKEMRTISGSKFENDTTIYEIYETIKKLCERPR